ncbi:MAG: flagellar basal body rod protein FlgC [Proteobacteria bacterium]|nr:flagellar basal body rod protein FlgC [Pseudomonadota bacterium]
MTDSLFGSLKTAASGLSAQSARLRVASENLANSHSTSATAGGDPYSRKTIAFASALDDESGVGEVKVTGIYRDAAPFRTEHIPGHPAADAQGMVKLPNVNPMIELADMREANRSYQANLQVVRQARDLINMTIDLLKANA